MPKMFQIKGFVSRGAQEERAKRRIPALGIATAWDRR